MKKILLFLFAIAAQSISINAQIRGNGQMNTEIRKLSDISEVQLDINAQVEIICSSTDERVEITMDENLLPYLATRQKGSKLILDQKEWISSAQEYIIKIYLKELSTLINDSWSKIEVNNIYQEEMAIIANISTIKLSGKTDKLLIKSESSQIDASNLISKEAKVTITDDGRVIINTSEKLSTKLSEYGHLQNLGDAKTKDGLTYQEEHSIDAKEFDTRFISFKIKNNSLRTIQAFVKGPKPDGTYFSYGLPLRPKQVRDENWSVGTKLYKVNMLGNRTLLHEVKEEDESRTVVVYPKA